MARSPALVASYDQVLKQAHDALMVRRRQFWADVDKIGEMDAMSVHIVLFATMDPRALASLLGVMILEAGRPGGEVE